MSETTQKKRILVVDDHPIVRHGLGQLIGHEKDMMVCGEAESQEEAMAVLAEAKPDVVLVDLTLKDSNGLNLIKELRSKRPHLPILVLSMHDEATYAERALRAGANGYVMKQQADDTVIRALRKVMAGELYVSEGVSAQMLRNFIDGPREEAGSSSVERLSNRELQVFELVGRGLSSHKIADKLELSIKTVEAHRAHIKKKLNIEDATQFIHQAIRWVEERNR